MDIIGMSTRRYVISVTALQGPTGEVLPLRGDDARLAADDCQIQLEGSKCSHRRDPLANSFIAPLTADPKDDARLHVEDFERSAEDDAEYGIDHLKLHDTDGTMQ